MRLLAATVLLVVAAPAFAQPAALPAVPRAKQLWKVSYQLPTPVTASTDSSSQPGDPGPDPEAAVRATVARLFDGMRARDTSAVRAAFHRDGRLHAIERVNESHRLDSGDVSGFIAALSASTAVWDERVADVDVRIDDGLASAWMAYRFFLDGRFSHCGIDAMTLVQDAAGWRILDLSYTTRTGCE